MNNDPFLTLSFFAGFSDAQLKVLRLVFLQQEFDNDIVIFEQGSPAEYFYIVVEGEVLVMFKPDDGPHLPVTRVRQGGVVGWSAAVGSRKYTSAAITTQPTCVLKVAGNELRHVFRKHPDIARIMKERLTSVIAERARSTHTHVLSLLDAGLSYQEEQEIPQK